MPYFSQQLAYEIFQQPNNNDDTDYDDDDDDDGPTELLYDDPYDHVRRVYIQNGNQELVDLMDEECQATAQRLHCSFSSRLKPYQIYLKALSTVNPKHSHRASKEAVSHAVNYLCECAGLNVHRVKSGLLELSTWYRCVLLVCNGAFIFIWTQRLWLLAFDDYRDLEQVDQVRVASAAMDNLWSWYHDEGNQFFQQDFSDQQTMSALLDFVAFVFSVEVSSSFTESVFSITKGTKNPHRSSLSIESVANYVRVGSTAPINSRAVFPTDIQLRSLDVDKYRWRKCSRRK